MDTKLDLALAQIQIEAAKAWSEANRYSGLVAEGCGGIENSLNEEETSGLARGMELALAILEAAGFKTTVPLAPLPKLCLDCEGEIAEPQLADDEPELCAGCAPEEV